MTTTLTDLDRHVLLARLANFLDDLPHDRFHMPAWCSIDATERSCGTAGCAAGWAATIYARIGWDITPPEEGLSFGQVMYDGKEGADAFAAFFALRIEESTWITGHLDAFSAAWGIDLPSHMPTYTREHCLKSAKDITPRHAAKRIRDVLARVDPDALAIAADSKPEPVAAQVSPC